MRAFRTAFAFLLALAVSAPAWAETVKLDLANEYPASSITGEGDTDLAKLVVEATKGEVVITPQPDAKLGLKTLDQFKAVESGKVGMATNFAGAIGSVDPIFLLSSLPFLAVTTAEAKALYEVARPRYEAALAKHNQVLLMVSPWPPSGLWSKTPVVTLKAFEGLKVRTYDSTGTAVFKALGSAPEEISFADAQKRLMAGTLDAVLSSGDGGAGRKLWEQLPNFAELNYAMPLSLTTINLEVWAKFDVATQAAIRHAAEQTGAKQWDRMTGRVEENYARMRQNNMTIATAPSLPADFKAALAKAGESSVVEWTKTAGPDGPAIVAEYKAKVGR